MTIKLWNWDKAWACQQVFEGHTHYVMQIIVNPKDNNTFASASLDRTGKKDFNLEFYHQMALFSGNVYFSSLRHAHYLIG